MAVPAIIATNAIPRLLETIRKVGIPDKIDRNYLKGLGFNNSNDAALISLFKSLGFLDPQGKPTEVYKRYRAANIEDSKGVLGGAIKSTYSGLFSTYPDAHRKDDEALANWLRANTDKGETTQSRALKTFKALRDAATFSENPADVPQSTQQTESASSDSAGTSTTPLRAQFQATTPDVTINITLQIAATNDASIYDTFFASMKRHLFPDES